MKDLERKLLEGLVCIYGQDQGESTYQRLLECLNHFKDHFQGKAVTKPDHRINPSESILITYGDMVHAEDEHPLKTLTTFLQKTLTNIISTVHILPFFPYSSDDGFSIIDYTQVNPAFGDWEDIEDLGGKFRLMFDAVINHISSQSAWFQGFLRGDPKYIDYFTVIEPNTDLSAVFRPRATPVLTPFNTPWGEKLVWTTFSTDQIDLNYKNPEVLLEVIKVLLDYVAHGAAFIRLDAVGFIWKEPGSSCIHLPQAHGIIQLFRTILDMIAPGVSLITETNVPHKENISYFGDGTNEAQMVYNFTLPPLTMHTFHTGKVAKLSEWAKTLSLPTDQVTFFNFTASHDGIGLMPVRGILSENEINAMVSRAESLGGYVSYKTNPDGSKSAYEININYLDALGDPETKDEEVELTARRFLCSQAIMLSLRGVPGIYFHSLFGSRSWQAGVEKSGRYRTINREKLERDPLERELAAPNSLRHLVYHGYLKLLETRKASPAFHPMGGQGILKVHPSVFAVQRTSPDRTVDMICLANVSNQAVTLDLDLPAPLITKAGDLFDTLIQQTFPINGRGVRINMTPYQVRWLKINGP